MSDSYSYTFGISTQTNPQQVHSQLQQATKAQQGKMVDDLFALTRLVARSVRFLLTLELPLLLSPTLTAPSMVAITSHR